MDSNQEKMDISSKEFQDAMKLHCDSILNILNCQKDLKECSVPMTKYAISILEKSLKN